MIYSHGNACDLGQMAYELHNYSIVFNINVIAYEYAGYGIRLGKASSENVKEDVMNVYNFLVHTLMVPPRNIVIFGRSIGTGPSCHVAGRIEELAEVTYVVDDVERSIGGLILQSPFTSVREIARSMVGWLIGTVAGVYFDNIGNIKKLRCPTIIIHGELDEVIPHTMGIQLHDECTSQDKELHIIPYADHNRWNEEEDILKPISAFLTSHFHPIDFEILPIPEDNRVPQIPAEVQSTSFFSMSSSKN
jgi:fermentation-respiration switch protein FrsA (DUF1100 family)